MRKITVLYISNCSVVGGSERIAIELAKRLDPDRFSIVFCALSQFQNQDIEKSVEDLERYGVSLLKVGRKPYSGYKEIIRPLQQISKCIRHHRVDIVHSHGGFSDVLAVLAKIHCQVKVCLRTIHGQVRRYNQPFVGFISERIIFPMLFDAEVCVAKAVMSGCYKERFLPFLKGDLYLIYNGIDYERFAGVNLDVKKKKEALGLNPQVPVVGFLGRLEEEKGLLYFLEAAKLLLNRTFDLQFLIVGDGTLRNLLEDKTYHLGIRQYIHFIGHRTDVPEILPIMNVIVSSSITEGLPLNLLEAMVASVPVVATDVSGNREIVRNGETGWLVPSKCPESLAEAIQRSLDHRDSAMEMAFRAKKNVKALFSVDEMVHQYEQLYGQLCRTG